MRRRPFGNRRVLAAFALFAGLAAASAGAAEPVPRRLPDLVLITVDTLRFDRLSSSGYQRPTTPHIDRLLAAGVRFTQARVPEPLTSPSMCSFLTSLHPHEHGSTRNGLRMRPGLASLSTVLGRRGYRTAAFVGNWTLRDELTGLAEHFDTYSEVLERHRWLFVAREANAQDLNEDALEWVAEHAAAPQRWPFLLWVHYVEPHAPYRFHEDLAEPLGIRRAGSDPTPSDRYDTEIAYVDRAIGELLAGLEKHTARRDTLIVFLSDHGESLGEHRYWGHGRHLYEPTVHVPMGIAWEGRIEPVTITALASSLDLTPTVLGLLGGEVPQAFRGFDWTDVLAGVAEAPTDRTTFHQAHRGAVKGGDSGQARRKGLLEVGLVEAAGPRKETLRVRGDLRNVFDLAADPQERESRSSLDTPASDALLGWLEQVREGLRASDELPPPSISEEDLEQLRALGYID